jgi:CarD family transcriptional regulator
MFNVGDRVVYPSQGAGVVKEITTRVVLGEKQEYLKVVFNKGNLEVLVPRRRGTDVGLRHTVDADEVPRLLDTLAGGDLKLPAAWPPRFRVEQEILERGEAYELARMIGQLARRDLEKGLAATEREMFDAARNALATELAVVQGCDMVAALATIDAVIEARISQA